MADLELEKFGFRFKVSPVVLATTFRDGTNGLICQDPERTAQNYALRSERDAKRMLGIQTRVHETQTEYNELSSFSPHPIHRSSSASRFGTTKRGTVRHGALHDHQPLLPHTSGSEGIFLAGGSVYPAIPGLIANPAAVSLAVCQDTGKRAWWRS